MNPIDRLHALGQSIWYDNIQRKLLKNGDIAAMIARGDIRGMTSNPSIFQQAITQSKDYDAALQPLAWAGLDAESTFFHLAIEDIQAAAKLFLPLYEATNGKDGFVSLEVSPLLAHDTEKTVAQAKELWQRVNCPNLMIKIPATLAGIPAITEVISAGINVNVTLIFSLARYQAVMDAYLKGLENRVAQGLPVDHIASVASFFISRVDSKLDPLLEQTGKTQPEKAGCASLLMGKMAIHNAKLAFADFSKTFTSDRFVKLAEKGAQKQRPLWASTSTKNPNYRDVLYVETLIGDSSVNTMPPETVLAFKDHGVAELTLEQGIKDAHDDFAKLATLGINFDQITDALEAEGVKKFIEAYQDLLHVIETRSAVFRSQLGSLAGAVKTELAAIENEKVVERIHAIDPTVWTMDAKGQEEIRVRLGWLTLPAEKILQVAELEAFKTTCMQDGLKKVLLLGMGGSSLAPEVLSLVFGAKADGMTLEILDSTHPGQVLDAAARFDVAETLFIVSSKSGTTSESQAMLDYFWHKAVAKLGDDAGKHFVAITDPGTVLEKKAQEKQFRRIFNANPKVGGRYSAFTAFGLVPAGLIGLDLQAFLRQAVDMQTICQQSQPVAGNAGAALGVVLGVAAKQGRDKLTLLVDKQIESFAAWLEQLIAESSGKGGMGVVPLASEPVVDAANYGNDRLFAYLRLDGQHDALVAQLIAMGHPVISFDLADVYALGAEFYRWEFATALACAVLGVNAFDQPNVQDNKDRTKRNIAYYQQNGSLNEGEPIWQDADYAVYGWEFEGIQACKSIQAVVNGLLAYAKAGDYVAINAYVPRNAENENNLGDLREKILLKTKCATTLGFGPRFLHSTGQLHKGGADNGVFLQITDEPAQDAEIPEEGLSFGVLVRAQALGDLEALVSRNRRAIRVHILKGDITNLL